MFSEFIAEKFHDPVIPGSLMDKPKRAATTDDNGGADSLVDVDLTLMQTQVPSKKSAESEEFFLQHPIIKDRSNITPRVSNFDLRSK